MAWKFLQHRFDNRNKKSGAYIVNEKGEKKVVLNPYGKGGKAAYELKHGVRVTNEGEVKKDKPLTKEGKAWRSGYLAARKDSARAWKSKNKKK